MHPISRKIQSQAVPYRCYGFLRAIQVHAYIHALFAMSLHRVELRSCSSSYVPLGGGVETHAVGLYYVSVLVYIHRHLYSGIVVELWLLSR